MPVITKETSPGTPVDKRYAVLIDESNNVINASNPLPVSTENENENQRILEADDAVTTINYTDATKDTVNNIITSSVILSRKVTDTYDNSGATTLIMTRVVADA